MTNLRIEKMAALEKLPEIDKHIQKELWRQNNKRFFCFGFGRWKYHFVRHYLFSPDGEVHFVKSTKQVKKAGIDERTILLKWGFKGPDDLETFAHSNQLPLYRMEDGFLRSIGLGSDLTIPASLVVDSQGIYFDPTGPSDMERILQTREFTPEEMERAKALRETITQLKISKYNVDGGDRIVVPKDKSRQVILVPGQVEDDWSIQKGTVDVCTNLDLLREARNANPDAYIVFKPHPDVVSGNRQGEVPDEMATQLADCVMEDSSIGHCLDIATEVHTMTSLVGFEALLRGLKVVVYGRPFYSSWGLTTDRHQISRRTRQLSLDELIFGTLIAYPRYIDMSTFVFTTPENIVLKLRQAREANPGQLKNKIGFLSRKTRKLIHIVKALLNVR